MLKRLLNTVTLTAVLATPALANEPEVVAEWNSLPYAVKDEATKSAWEGSEIFGKALVGDVSRPSSRAVLTPSMKVFSAQVHVQDTNPRKRTPPRRRLLRKNFVV